MAQYKEAPQVKKVAEELIEVHHPHLVGIPMRYVFRDAAKKSGGKEVWGTAKKKSGEDAYLAATLGSREFSSGQPYFLIEVAFDVWEGLTLHQRRALVDHECCHCVVDADGELVLRRHDFEDFVEVVRRHGVEWSYGLKRFAGAASAWYGQIGLPLEDQEHGLAPEGILEEVLDRHLPTESVLRQRILSDLRPYLRLGDRAAAAAAADLSTPCPPGTTVSVVEGGKVLPAATGPAPGAAGAPAGVPSSVTLPGGAQNRKLLSDAAEQLRRQAGS